MSNSYKPLHHKYRPQSFNDLVGQEPIASTLSQALKTSRIAPAYLFSGPRGTGKTSSARILAKSLNCLNSDKPTTEPCGHCELCKSISNGSALDVIEIDAASNTGVDNIRELIEKSRFVPVQARWKVYVIDECHMLSTAAFNALLKTLEEPPSHVVFVLATTDPQRVIPTILSRCQRFDFRRIPIETIAEQLTKISSQEKILIEPDALEIIAQRAQGGLRDAESLLDQLSLIPGTIKANSVFELIGAVPEEEIIKLLNSLIKKDPLSLLDACKNLLERGREPISIIQGLAGVIRDLLIIKLDANRTELITTSKQFHSLLKAMGKEINSQQLLLWQAELKGSENQLRHSMQPRLWLEIILLGLLAERSNMIKTVKEVQTKYNNQSQIQNKSIHRVNEINTKEPSKEDMKLSNQSKPESSEELKQRSLKDEPSNLQELWQQILGSLELPSTRMLLSQQAELTHIDNKRAVIQVSGNWINMVQSRASLLEKAIILATGSEKKLIIEEQNRINQINNKSNVGKNITPSTVPHPEPLKTVQETSNEEQKNASERKSTLSYENLESPAKKLASFFNGEVIEE